MKNQEITFFEGWRIEYEVVCKNDGVECFRITRTVGYIGDIKDRSKVMAHVNEDAKPEILKYIKSQQNDQGEKVDIKFDMYFDIISTVEFTYNAKMMFR